MSGAEWVHDVLGPTLQRAAQAQAEAEEHAATCTARPCERCHRYVCPCGAAVDGMPECDACYRAKVLESQLAPTRKSVPRRFAWALDADLDTLRARVRATKDLIARAVESPPAGNLVFVGDTGSGKTSLAVAMLGAWVRVAPELRKGARFAEAYSLAMARARYPLGEGEPPEVDDAMGAPLLVLDDLGSERDDRNNVLADVIFERHNADLPTWITTWLSQEKCIERYGSGLTRRIFETAKVVRLRAEASR